MSERDLIDVEDAVLNTLRELKESAKIPKVRELIELLEEKGFTREEVLEALDSLRKEGSIRLADHPPAESFVIPDVSPAEGLNLEELPPAIVELVEEVEELLDVLRSMAKGEAKSES